MRGELREHHVTRVEQLACTGDVSEVGVDLLGIDWEVRQPIDLCTFDFRIPVCALDQADHDAAAAAAGQIDDPVDHEGAALLVCLDHEAQPVPPGKIGIGGQRLEQVEREF